MATDEIVEVTPQTADQWRESGEAILIDVRETSEYDYEHIPGSLLLPLSFLDPDVFPPLKDKKLVMICAIGKRSAAAYKQLAKAGYENMFNLEGGIGAWRKADLELQGVRFEEEDYSV
ncbi:MAG: rhodanese-like domain-containing protein [Rhodospirillales bacterium]|nr:rhodanese-like domain-containing protein [Rhodospirillales bacterium]